LATAWSIPSSSASRSVTTSKPPETIATVYPRRFSVRTNVRAPGVSRTSSPTSRSTLAGVPARRSTRSRSDVLEVHLTGHRPGGDVGDLALTPGARSASSSITSSWISVESTSSTTSRLARRLEVLALQGHVDAVLPGGRDQGGPHLVEVAIQHRELVGRHRLAGEADDPVDVPATGRDRAGDRAERAGGQRLADHGDDGPQRRWRGLRRLHHLEVQLEPVLPAVEEQLLQDVVEPPEPDRQVQGELAADDHLLHVVQLGAGRVGTR
jgi:hypothetical protein